MKQIIISTEALKKKLKIYDIGIPGNLGSGSRLGQNHGSGKELFLSNPDPNNVEWFIVTVDMKLVPGLHVEIFRHRSGSETFQFGSGSHFLF